MRKAKLTFEITMKYEMFVEEYDEDYTLEQEIQLQKEYLETQREDLYCALQCSELVSVKIIEKEIKN